MPAESGFVEPNQRQSVSKVLKLEGADEVQNHPRQCTARRKRSQERCRAYAVRGTDKCRCHGGMTPVKHGLYSKYSQTRLADKIDQLKDDPELVDIRQHVALLTALLMERLEHSPEITEDTAESLAGLIEKLTRGIERWYKVTYGEKYILQVEQVQALILAVASVVDDEIADQATVDRIAARLQQLPIRGA